MKRKLKKILVNILTCKTITKLGNWVYGNGVPIFMLHRMQDKSLSINGTPAEHLRKCLHHLTSNGYSFMSLEELLRSLHKRRPVPKKSVVFTMDDGFADQLEIAAPIFLEFNCPVTIFLITGMLDNILWPWDDMLAHIIHSSQSKKIDISLEGEYFMLPLLSSNDKSEALNTLRNTIKSLSAENTYKHINAIAENIGVIIPDTPPEKYRSITWAQARNYEKKGILFAPHTVTHRILSKLDDISANDELIKSWQRINEELTAPSPVFCYPTGRYCDYGPRETEILIKHGFVGAVSTIPAQVETISKPPKYYFGLPRLDFPTDFVDFVHDSSWLGHVRNKANPLTRCFNK